MAITVGQIQSTLTTLQSLNEVLTNLEALLGQANSLANNGWVLTIGTTAQIQVPVTPAMQAQLVAQYDSLKSQLVTIFNQLP